jgi:hypothetical protein
MLLDSFALVDLIVPLDYRLRTIRASYFPVLAHAAVDDKKLRSILVAGQVLEWIGRVETFGDTM